MKIAVTGSHGTLGSALVPYLKGQGHDVVAWDRAKVPITEYWAMEEFLRSSRVKALFHLAVPSQPTGAEPTILRPATSNSRTTAV